MQWIISDTDSVAAAGLAAALGISLPVARVLCARGLGDALAVRRFLAPSATDLHDPFMLAGMAASLVAMLVDKHSFYDHLKYQYMHELIRDEAVAPDARPAGQEDPDA